MRQYKIFYSILSVIFCVQLVVHGQNTNSVRQASDFNLLGIGENPNFVESLLRPAAAKWEKDEAEKSAIPANLKVVRLDAAQVERQVRDGNSFVLDSDYGRFVFDLQLNDLRDKNFRAEKTVEGNRIVPITDFKVNTFKGKIRGAENSDARLTIDGTIIEGILWVGDEQYFIQPARRYISDASSGDFVIFRASDLSGAAIPNCAAPSVPKIEGQISNRPSITDAPESLRMIQIAAEIDYDYVLAAGGVAQAYNEVFTVINQIDGVYRRELGMTFAVTYINAWEMTDPYTSNDDLTLLNQFTNYWNANRANVPRNIAHLWSINAQGGLAWAGVACNPSYPGYRYSLNGRYGFPLAYAYTAHEIAHQFGASHSSEQPGCQGTIMGGSNGTPAQLTFCQYSRTEILNYLANQPSNCLYQTRNTPLDFDNDGIAELGVFRPSNGGWYFYNISGNFSFSTQFGISTDKIVPADYDGDGKTDVAVYRDGTWYLNRSQAGFTGISFGTATDIPVPADFTGDGKADLAVFRPSTGAWFIYNLANNLTNGISFGQNGDSPIPADYDGDNKADVAVFRNGTWYIQRSTAGFLGVQFGEAADKPVPADYDGDIKADVSVFRPSNGTWYLNRSQSGFTGIAFGTSTDIPVPADYDGDGRANVGVFRNGAWYFDRFTQGITCVTFGASTDMPVSNTVR